MFTSFRRKFKESDNDANEDEARGMMVLADTVISFLIVTIALFTLILMLPHAKKAEQSVSNMGVICAELTWPDRDIDLDLWGHSPHDPYSVGYTNMHGVTLNLLRDVIGRSYNPTHQMMEIQCADQLTPGEWTFNVHYFANHEKELEGTLIDDPRKKVEATLVVRIRNDGQTSGAATYKDTFMTRLQFDREKEELTAVDFVVDENGSVIHSTINSLYKPVKQGGWNKQ